MVRWLTEHGFKTTDSGDGVSKFEDEETMCRCALDVAIQTSPAKLISECDRLTALLLEKGVVPEPLGPDEFG